MISAIVAVTRNNIIGDAESIPWYLPADLRHFKEHTVGTSVIMGRTTYDSIVNRIGKPLPDRQNIVMTRSPEFTSPGVTIAHTIEEALEAAEFSEVMIIGGAQIYSLAAPLIDRWYVTEIDTTIDGSVTLEGFNRSEFSETYRETFQKDDKNPYNYSFVTYERQ